jgi:hypothetical protein
MGGLEASGRGLIEVPSRHLPGATEKTAVRIASVATEIQTKRLTNMSLQHYRYTEFRIGRPYRRGVSNSDHIPSILLLLQYSTVVLAC